MDQLIISTLKDRPSFEQQTVKLIEQSFGYQENFHFHHDFFSLINSQNHHHNFILLKDNLLIGHIGIKEKHFSTTDFSLKVAFIGGIAIDKQYRGIGYFKYFFESILKKIEKEYPLFFLWSDKPSLYEKFGFYLSIGQIEVKGLGKNSNLTKTKYRNLSNEDKDRIKHLYKYFLEKKFLTITRGNLEWLEIEQIVSADLFIKRNNEGEIIAYCFQNKGKDLQGITYELGLLDEKHLVEFINDTNFTFWLSEKYHPQFLDATVQYGALLKIGNTHLFSEFVENFSDGNIHLTKIDENKITFLFEDTIFHLTPKEFLTSMLGPYPVKEFMDFNKFFFISGIDSV